MLYTPHFLTGAAIVRYFPDPYIGYPLALLSHVLLDLIPHHDFDIVPGMDISDILFKDKRKGRILLGVLGADLILTGASFIWLIMAYGNISLVIGGIVAILPDVLEQFFLLLGRPLRSFQMLFQTRVSAKYGFISYPIVSLISLYLLIR